MTAHFFKHFFRLIFLLLFPIANLVMVPILPFFALHLKVLHIHSVILFFLEEFFLLLFELILQFFFRLSRSSFFSLLIFMTFE